jgi:hypothetical protein
MTGNLSVAREFYSRAVIEGSTSPDLFYAVACLDSMEGYPGQSFAALTTAFEKGLKAKNMHDDERCLAVMKGEPRLNQMIRQALGE